MAAVRIVDLIARLQEIVDDYGVAATIAVAHQENYPLRVDVEGVAATADLVDDDVEDVDNLPTAWLATTSPEYAANPYAPRAVWEVAERL